MTGRDRTRGRGIPATAILAGGISRHGESCPCSYCREPAASVSVDALTEIRAILVAAGVPPGDLEWLVRSCPSIEDARSYRPPARQAWCLDCDDVQPCDDGGCLTCRGAR